MQAAMHAARLVAAQSALLALLVEQQYENPNPVDGITACLTHAEHGQSLDFTYTSNGLPVGGEGI